MSAMLKLFDVSPKLKVPLLYIIWKGDFPKKVKVFLWSLAYRSLNRLQRKRPNWTMSLSVYLLCLRKKLLTMFSSTALLATKGWHFLFCVFGLSGCMPCSIEVWLAEAPQGGSLKGKGRSFGLVLLELSLGIFGSKEIVGFFKTCLLLLSLFMIVYR